MPQEFWANALFSVIPTVLFGVLFWIVMRAIVRADRNERKVYARIEAEELARRERAKRAESRAVEGGSAETA